MCQRIRQRTGLSKSDRAKENERQYVAATGGNSPSRLARPPSDRQFPIDKGTRKRTQQNRIRHRSKGVSTVPTLREDHCALFTQNTSRDEISAIHVTLG